MTSSARGGDRCADGIEYLLYPGYPISPVLRKRFARRLGRTPDGVSRPATPRQRDAHEQIVGDGFGAVQRANAVTARQRPIEFDITERVLLAALDCVLTQ
ncbi:hypothetical protein [Nocardia niwae]|uniref:hypothetical protein n=1 Tax=Nocardia niwae TaxID=626084 RepID=UPI0033F0E312